MSPLLPSLFFCFLFATPFTQTFAQNNNNPQWSALGVPSSDPPLQSVAAHCIVPDLTSSPHPRTLLPSRAVVFGGYVNGVRSSEAYLWDVKTQWNSHLSGTSGTSQSLTAIPLVSARPQRRSEPSCAAFLTGETMNILAVGGRDTIDLVEPLLMLSVNRTGSALGAVSGSWDSAPSTWTGAGTVIPSSYANGLVWMQNLQAAVLFGGSGLSGLESIGGPFVISPSARKVQPAPLIQLPHPENRSFAAFVAISDTTRIVLFGGYNWPLQKRFSDVWVLNTVVSPFTWTEQNSAAFAPGRSAFVFGYVPALLPAQTPEAYSLATGLYFGYGAEGPITGTVRPTTTTFYTLGNEPWIWANATKLPQSQQGTPPPVFRAASIVVDVGPSNGPGEVGLALLGGRLDVVQTSAVMNAYLLWGDTPPAGPPSPPSPAADEETTSAGASVVMIVLAAVGAAVIVVLLLAGIVFLRRRNSSSSSTEVSIPGIDERASSHYHTTDAVAADGEYQNSDVAANGGEYNTVDDVGGGEYQTIDATDTGEYNTVDGVGDGEYQTVDDATDTGEYNTSGA
jgi:Galactose oxidase, central domain